MELNICFVGIGSIARRHMQNLKRVCNRRGIALNMDAVRREKMPVNGIRNVYTDVCETDITYDVIFITNPTEYHMDALYKAMDKGRNFFIEKPVVSFHQIESVSKIGLKKNAVYYVACPLRYNAVIQYIKSNIEVSDIISVRSISSSYLPEWRPQTDYRVSYSAHKSMGGGVSIDLIHEWDYLTYLFGIPKKIKSFIGKKSFLEIDSDDFAVYIAEYADKIVELHLDYFGRKAIREIMLITKDDTIIGDIANDRICYLKSGKVLEFHESRDAFQTRELEYFIDMVLGQTKKNSNIAHAIEVLKLTQGELSL